MSWWQWRQTKVWNCPIQSSPSYLVKSLARGRLACVILPKERSKMGRVYSTTTMSLSISQTIGAPAKQKTKRSERRPGSVGPWGWILVGLQSIRTIWESTVPSAGSAIQWIDRTELTYNSNHHKVILIVDLVLPTFNADLNSQKRLYVMQTSITELSHERLRSDCYLATIELMSKRTVQMRKRQQVLTRIFDENCT